MCREKAVQEDNLSLLDGISTQKAINQYEKKGLFTVKQLSYTFKPRRRRKRAKNPPPVIHKPELQALAIREQKIYLQELPELTRQPVELFLDIEGIPDQQFYYLIGLLVSEKDTTIYYPFWADTPEDEAQIWGEFLEKVDQYPDSPIYHYGNYDARAIAKLGRRYDTDIEDLINRLVNVNKHIYGKVYFPVYSNRLKELSTFIGATWTSPKASGLQSLVWRYRWGETLTEKYKMLLVTYNEEDCVALKKLAESLSGMIKLEECVNVNEMEYWTNFKFGGNKYESDSFELITRFAYFDYQRKKIYFRNNKNLRKKYAKRQRVSQIKYRINQHIDVIPPECCPNCENTDLRLNGNYVPKLVIDLKFFNGGIKRWVTKIVRKRFSCPNCNRIFFPDNVKDISKYGRNLMVWSVNQLVAHRMSIEKIEETLAESFNLHLRKGVVRYFKEKLSKTYQATYDEIKQSILDGKLIHADETRVNVKGTDGYVWVFTNIDSVFYTFRATRETEFLTDMLADFKGVLISDFYSGYDSLLCLHQKCLIHLVRDINDDLFRNPLDLEFVQLVTGFAQLLRLIVETIDKYGLKKRNLNKHQQDVEKFYKRIIDQSSKSELTQKYQKRFRRYKESLFIFLKHDGIPWNNNNAEHAIKPFAAYRRSRDGTFTERSIQEYLILLSVQQTCRYQELSFFEFLKSGKQSLAEFANM
jgi:transposase-like protein